MVASITFLRPGAFNLARCARPSCVRWQRRRMPTAFLPRQWLPPCVHLSVRRWLAPARTGTASYSTFGLVVHLLPQLPSSQCAAQSNTNKFHLLITLFFKVGFIFNVAGYVYNSHILLSKFYASSVLLRDYQHGEDRRAGLGVRQLAAVVPPTTRWHPPPHIAPAITPPEYACNCIRCAKQWQAALSSQSVERPAW